MSARPLDPRHHAALAAVLKQRGLGLDGRPLPGTPGSLLSAPVTSARYESDLGQVQRATRAQSASEARAVSTRPAIPGRAEAAYRSHLLPKMLVPEDAARRLEAEHDRAAGTRAAGEAGFDFRFDGRRTAEQAQRQVAENQATLERRTREEKERGVYEALMPDHPVTDILGKAGAYPLTAIGGWLRKCAGCADCRQEGRSHNGGEQRAPVRGRLDR